MAAVAKSVLVVNHAVDLGGAELTLLTLLAERPPDLRVTLAVPSDGPLAVQARALGVEVVLAGPGEATLGLRRTGEPLPLRRALEALVQLGPGVARLAKLARGADVVLTNSTKAHLYGSAAARVVGRRCVWRLHDVVDAEGFSGPVRGLVLGAARVLAGRVLPVSEAAAKPIRDAGVADVRVCPNGVDLAALAPEPGARAKIRSEFGILEGVPVALLLGRLTPLKGAEVLFQAMRAVPGLHAIVAGEATFSEVEGYGEVLRREAAALGGRVVFAGFRRDVPALLAASDVLVHPSVKPDSLPTAVLEAIAAGVPVVASTAGGAAEVLADERGGLLVPPRDVAALARALERVITDRDLAMRLGEAGRVRARDYERRAACARIWAAVREE